MLVLLIFPRNVFMFRYLGMVLFAMTLLRILLLSNGGSVECFWTHLAYIFKSNEMETLSKLNEKWMSLHSQCKMYICLRSKGRVRRIHSWFLCNCANPNEIAHWPVLTFNALKILCRKTLSERLGKLCAVADIAIIRRKTVDEIWMLMRNLRSMEKK